MYLPAKLQQKNFVEWNYLVTGLMEVWEVANQMNLEQPLERKLEQDSDGTLAEWLGHIGNDLRRAEDALRMCEARKDPNAQRFLRQILTISAGKETLPLMKLVVGPPHIGTAPAFLTLQSLAPTAEPGRLLSV